MLSDFYSGMDVKVTVSMKANHFFVFYNYNHEIEILLLISKDVFSVHGSSKLSSVQTIFENSYVQLRLALGFDEMKLLIDSRPIEKLANLQETLKLSVENLNQ